MYIWLKLLGSMNRFIFHLDENKVYKYMSGFPVGSVCYKDSLQEGCLSFSCFFFLKMTKDCFMIYLFFVSS